MIDMYGKVSLITLVLFGVVRSEEISSDTKIDTKFLDSSLSTAFPYLSPYNDQYLTKDDQKKSLLLLMPHIQHEYKNKTIHKTKRCNTLSQKKRLLSTKENFARTRSKSSDENINVELSKDDLNIYNLARNTKNIQESSAISDKIEIKPHKKDKILLRILKDVVDGKDVIVNLQSRENIKKCDMGNCICYCKDENCFPTSSKKSSSQTLGSSRKDKPKRINHRIPEHKNKQLNILQRKPSRLQHENPYQSRIPNLINSFPIRYYQERLSDIPAILIRYGIIPNLPSYMTGNVGKDVNVGIPATSFESKPNFLFGKNVHPQYRPFIHQNAYLNLPVTEKSREAERFDTSISSSMNYIDATVTETGSILKSYNPTGIIGKTQEPPELTTKISNDYLGELIDTITENNFNPNYSTNVIEENNIVEFSSLDETLHKSEDSTETTEANKENDLISSILTDYINTSRIPSIIYSPITHDGKLINMEECIKLFGRDVCVISAISSADQTRKNNLNRYTTIAIPQYVKQTSTKKDMTTDYVNYSNKHFASILSTSEKSNIDSNENSESTNTELNIVGETSLPELSQYTNSIVQTYESHADFDKDELSNIGKDIPIPKKKMKLSTQTTDKIIGTIDNKLLGKSKSHKNKLSLNPNSKEMKNPVSTEEFFHSTTSHKCNDKKINTLEVNQQNWATSASTWKNIPQEETTVTSYLDSRIKHDFEKESINYLKESVTNNYPEEEILQERLKEEAATINHDYDIEYNFETETMKPSFNIYSDEEGLQFTTMRYIELYEDSNESNNKDNNFNTDLSTRRLPFCDNTLLLNSIRKVINDFTLDTRIGRTEDLDENILHLHGKHLLPEILEVPHLKHILLIPQIEDMTVENIKDVLSEVTGIPREDFMNDWSHNVIRNTLRSILEAFPDLHRKLPPMTVEEHQFKNGQWTTNLVTLVPIIDNQLSHSEKLQKSIRDHLSSPAIASQTDHHIVRNIIVQSVKNSLINDEGNEKMDDSIIYNALNDILQILKEPEDVNILKESNKFVSTDKNTKMTVLQEMPTGRYEMENIDKSILDKQKLDIEEEPSKSNNKAIHITKENTGNQILDGIKKIDVQNEESKLVESLKPIIIYEKAILQNNPNILKAPIKSNTRLNSEGNNKNIFTGATTISSITAKILSEKSGEKELSEINPIIIHTKSDINKPPINDFSSNDWILEKTENHGNEIITPIYFMQETSPDYIQVSSDIISPDMAHTKNVGDIEYSLNRNIVTTLPDNLISAANVKYENPKSEITVISSAEIDPAIIQARLEYNLPSIKYYSPEILKNVQNHHIEDKNKITTSTNYMQKISPNHIQISDSMIEQGAKNARDEIKDTLNEEILITSTDNLISSENNIPKYGNHESHTFPLTDEDILKLQQRNFTTENNIVKIHEITTEIQRTYAKTTYFKPKSSNNSSRINLFSSTPEITGDASNSNSKSKNNMNGNRNNNNYDLIDNNINDINCISTETNEAIISSSKSSLDDIYSLQLFPSSTASNDISELQKSQLYYINDGVKLPLKIIKLKDGSYALSISKDICEIILRRKCPCCVPLQGRIVRSSSKNHQKDINVEDENYWSTNHSPSIAINSMITKNSLKTQKQDEQEERINAHQLWKRNLNKTISMPVIDFARKYNLLLNFNGEDVLFNRMESQKRNIELSQSRKLEESKLNKSKIKNNMQNTNTEIAEDNYSDIEKIMKYEKETNNSLLQDVNILNKKEKREHKESELINDKQNVSKIRIFKENNARPYRYEQNMNVANRGTKIIKSMLYWLKSLFEKNE